jgi:cyanophycinase
MERLLASRFQEEFRDYHNNGGDIIGTSAGASFMGEIMPLGNTHAQGFGLVPHIIDQHFSQGNRMGRLVNLVREFPDRIGIGIDENTAVIYTDSQMQIMGEGQVYVISSQESSGIHEVVLSEGDVFDLSRISSYGDVAAG